MRARETVVDRLLLRRGRGVRKCGSLQVVEMFFLLALPYVPPFYTGIISWGPNSCGEKYRPGVYTRSTLQIVFLNIIKKRLLLELATTSLGLCGTQRNTRTTGHITQFSQIQSWFQSSHTKNKYTQ